MAVEPTDTTELFLLPACAAPQEKGRAPESNAEITRAPQGARVTLQDLASTALADSLLSLGLLRCLTPPFFLYWDVLSALCLPHYGFGECIISTFTSS